MFTIKNIAFVPIITMEDNLIVKEPYIWDYTISVKTKDGTFVHEHEQIENIDNVLAQHPGYTGVQAIRNDTKVKVKKLTKNSAGGKHGV